MTNPFVIIPDQIYEYWKKKYGQYLMAYESQDFIIFYENGRLDCFHPSGDRLARHNKLTRETFYIWNNKTNKMLTETDYIARIKE